MKKKFKTAFRNLQKNEIRSRSTIKLDHKKQELGAGLAVDRPRMDLGLDFVFFFETQHSSSAFLYCFDKGVDFYNYRKFMFAENMFRKAVEVDKKNIFAINNLAICQIKMQNLVESIKNLHTVMQIDRLQEFSYYNIALGYLLFNKVQEATLCVQSAASMFPNLPEGLSKLQKIIQSLLPTHKKLQITQTKSKLTLSTPRLPGFSSIFSQKTVEDLSLSTMSRLSVTRLHEDSSFSSFDETEEINNKVLHLKKKVKKTMKKLEDSEIKPATKLQTKYVTEEELRELISEFNKGASEKDYSKIDAILNKLTFFTSFPLETRQLIYSISTIQICPPGTVVFRQGDSGNSMYVVIKGSISIEKHGPEFGNKKIVVNTVYDGKQFGDLALLSSIDSKIYTNQRQATCIASEQTTLLCIPRDTLSHIILHKNKEDLEEKISTLEKTLIFKGFTKRHLLPLALNLETLTFKLNDTILAKGQVPSGLYIIKKGFLDLIHEENIKKDYKTEELQYRPHSRKLSPMLFTKTPDRTRSKSPETSQNLVIKEKMIISSLKELDFFASRTLKNVFQANRAVKPSKFSVVVQSSTAEVLLVTNFHLQYLTQDMLIQLAAVVDKTDDPDCPSGLSSVQIKKLFHNWHNYKSQLVRNIHNDYFWARNK